MMNQDSAPVLEFRHVTFEYSPGSPLSQKALRGIDLTVRPGEFIGIIGHTGSGKSTLIQHCNGLLKPTGGQVLFHGEDIHGKGCDLRKLRSRVGLVFQYPEYQLFEETVFADIAFGPKNMGLGESEIRERVESAASFVGLGEELMQASPFELSGGQKRRVAIAGVIAMHPEVLILDEPTAGLDPGGGRQILGQVEAYRKATGATILLVTHNMEFIAGTAERLLVVRQGQIAMDGPTETVFADPSRLTEMALDVPQVTRVFMELRAMGADVGTDVYTLPYAVKKLCERFGKPLPEKEADR